MIIDIHTHSFPESIAARAVAKLAAAAQSNNYLDGTTSALSSSTISASVDYSILQPVATSPSQTTRINETAAIVNQTSQESHLISFAGIHPANEDYKNILMDISKKGFKGIKLHPVYQDAFFDSDEIVRLVDLANELELVTLFHAGYDIGFPGRPEACVRYILNFMKKVDTSRVVLAHMGGWNEWDDVEKYLTGAPIFFDTSFSITPVRYTSPEGGEPMTRAQLPPEKFLRIVRKHGCDKILFGSDSPWSSQAEAIAAVRKSGLDEAEINNILGNNASSLLKLKK